MKRWVLVGLLVSCATMATAQSIAVGYRETVRVAYPGALAAFSLNDFFAEAKAESGTLTVFGKNPGSAHIVVVTEDGSKNVEVRIIPAPPSYPPGFILPLSEAAAREGGSYESRFTSGPSQSEDTVDFMRREGERSLRFHMADTFLFSPIADHSVVALSSVFYTIATPARDITFLDQLMINSPLTVYESIVRGFHMRQGNFLFHVGYTSTTSFENIILPSQKEGVVGVGYRFQVSDHAFLIPNCYFFPGKQVSGNSAQPGVVTSLVYDYEVGKDLGLLTEVGFSRGAGTAEQIHFHGARDQLAANLRYEPRRFASLGANSLHGFYSNVNWTRSLTRRLTSTSSFTGNHYNLPSLKLTNLVSNLDLQFQLSRRWSVVSGANYARSQSYLPAGPIISVAGVPLGLNFDALHFQSGVLYQYSKDSGPISRSSEFRTTVGTHWRGFRWSGFMERQTQALTLAFVSAGVPGLQGALDKLGISAVTPDQIALALNESAGLLNQGLIEGIGINVNPIRLQAGSDLTWSNRAGTRQRFDLSVLYNRDELAKGETRTTIATFSYSVKFKRVNELFSSISLLRDGTRLGQNDPLFEISIRRQVGSVPNFVMSRRRGTISGVVFADDGATGTYGPGALPLAEVEVILDDKRRIRTDKSGRYRFVGISYGSHSVEAIYHSANPFFYTTASKVQSDVNTEINFGVGLSFARLFGSVRSDSGTGLPEVEISVSRGPQGVRARTDSEGKFHVEGLSSGEYEIKIDPDSVPPGYSLGELETKRVTVDPAVPAQSDFKLKAIRNISGRVTIYDPVFQKNVPVAGIAVRLLQLSRENVTDENGIYLFRDLPPGSYSLTITYQRNESKREVILPDGPAFPKNINIDVVAR
jgi:hypothetical protein